jgi:hypothetical protein
MPVRVFIPPRLAAFITSRLGASMMAVEWAGKRVFRRLGEGE